MADSPGPEPQRRSLSSAGNAAGTVTLIAPGQTLAGKYKVGQLLGAGAMGMVFKVEDLDLDGRVFAIKVLPPELAHNESSVIRLKKEALSAIDLHHSNIMAVNAFESDGANFFLVMEYLDGPDLEKALAQKERYTTDEMLDVARQVCPALAYAHGRNVVHRDIKPANLLYKTEGDRRVVKVADFGIAYQIKDSMTRLTGTESAGTLLYVAPEQLKGDRPSAASDQYSLAATLYELLRGEPPFVGTALTHQVLNATPRPIADAPDHVNAALLRALAKEPKDRFPDCGAFLKALETKPEEAPVAQPPARALPDPVPVASPPPPPRLAPPTGVAATPPSSSRPALLFGALLVVLAVGYVLPRVRGAASLVRPSGSSEAQSKARRDLDTLRTACGLHDAQNTPLNGTSLRPLLGRYVAELAKDPWGNDYAFDASIGLLISFGADCQAGGAGDDADVYVFTRPELRIQRVQYEGSWGRPQPGTRLVVTLSKPYRWASGGLPALKRSLCLLTNIRDLEDGGQRSLEELEAPRPGGRQAYELDGAPASGGLQDPTAGLVALRQTAKLYSDAQSLTPTMSMNFTYTATEQALEKFGITEAWLPMGPLDENRFGSQAQRLYRRAPQPIPLYGQGAEARNRGVRLERF